MHFDLGLIFDLVIFVNEYKRPFTGIVPELDDDAIIEYLIKKDLDLTGIHKCFRHFVYDYVRDNYLGLFKDVHSIEIELANIILNKEKEFTYGL